ncbi:hypothetical protein [Nocardia neocaledoniensis]|uniref:hypothetical protein n=1 Tax=Nocardia neocaledoniensis TaxID=236511 RepID=UPI0024542DC9|nr:hypothetical protein [Nocardia neocaledoniensis]
MPLPDMHPRDREVAAAECDAIADYLDTLAGIVDGQVAAAVARSHRSAAAAVRARGDRHRELAKREYVGQLRPVCDP